MNRSYLVAALAALTLLAPVTQAVEAPFGSAVGSSDYDFSPLAETQRVALCYIDFNGDALLSANEPVLLLTRVTTNGVCPATLSNNAILLNSLDGRAAGTELNQLDKWSSKAIRTLTGTHLVRYFEDGSDASKFDAKDTLYLDLKNTGGSRVDVGDLRLAPMSPFKAGTIVVAGDVDVNRPLTNIRSVARQIHDANVVYKAGSAFYVNADAGTLGGSVDGTCAATSCPVTGDFGVESGDVRLNPKAVNPLTDKHAITVQGLNLSAFIVAPGEPFQLSILVKNDGKGAGSGLVKTSLDGVLVDARGTPTLYATESATLVLTLTAPSEVGRFAVKAGDFTIFLDVEGEAVHDGSSSEVAALAARIALLERSLAPGDAVEVASADVQGAAGPMPVIILGLVLVVAFMLRRRSA